MASVEGELSELADRLPDERARPAAVSTIRLFG